MKQYCLLIQDIYDDKNYISMDRESFKSLAEAIEYAGYFRHEEKRAGRIERAFAIIKIDTEDSSFVELVYNKDQIYDMINDHEFMMRL